MEHEEFTLIQAIRMQLGLATPREEYSTPAFIDKRQERLELFDRGTDLETTAVDRILNARANYQERQLLEGMTATEIAERMKFILQPNMPNSLKNSPVTLAGIRKEMEILKEAQFRKFAFSTPYIRIVETEHITKQVQTRTHRKKRINKKWRKRYGMKNVEDIYKAVIYTEPSGERVLMVHPKIMNRIREKIDTSQGVEFERSNL